MQNTEFLSEKQAATFLSGGGPPISTKTLQRWRCTGYGPIFVKAGHRVLYAGDDLRAWLNAQRRRSTSDPGSAA